MPGPAGGQEPGERKRMIYVREDGSSCNPIKTYVLAELRCALLRTKLAAADLEAIGVALTLDLITPDAAGDAARQVNAHHPGAPVPFLDEAWLIDPPQSAAGSVNAA